jgi:hypothetical protein
MATKAIFVGINKHLFKLLTIPAITVWKFRIYVWPRCMCLRRLRKLSFLETSGVGADGVDSLATV